MIFIEIFYWNYLYSKMAILHEEANRYFILKIYYQKITLRKTDFLNFNIKNKTCFQKIEKYRFRMVYSFTNFDKSPLYFHAWTLLAYEVHAWKKSVLLIEDIRHNYLFLIRWFIRPWGFQFFKKTLMRRFFSKYFIFGYLIKISLCSRKINPTL